MCLKPCVIILGGVVLELVETQLASLDAGMNGFTGLMMGFADTSSNNEKFELQYPRTRVLCKVHKAA